MVKLNLRFRRTPYGVRLAGPDPDRTLYLGDGHSRGVKPHDNGEEAIWSCPDFDLFVTPVADGVEITLKVHFPKTQAGQASAEAA